MSLARLSNRYAKSLIGLAEEQNKLEEIFQDALTLEAMIESSQEFKVFLKSPVINTDKKKAVLDELLENKVSDMSMSFIDLLLKKGREEYIAEIYFSVIDQYKEIKKIKSVSLSTAVEIAPEIIDQIKNKVSLDPEVKIELSTKIDPELIGGFVITYDDKQFDASVARQLENLKTQIHDDSYVAKM